MLSILPDTELRVVTAAGDTKLVAAKEAATSFVYDWFGATVPFVINGAPNERLYRLTTLNGEPIYVGENHSVLCRKRDSAQYRRVPVRELIEPVFVHLPQRKVRLDDESPFHALDADDDGIFLKPADVLQFRPLMRTMATAGVAVHRRPSELRIDLEKGRPVCYALKLINGNFDVDLKATLEALTSVAVVQPCRLFDDQLIENVRKTGIVFEGASLYNETLLLPPEPIEKEASVYHVTCQAPVELLWFMT